ncbi:MAG: pyridoxal-phosphate dependent enzyme [Selenomonadaceae bacterium]|nr:pyridoxal-phosphate dependent enzyme [Selenomonadaceae bacterium]MBR1804827.1 pyridoxal-phosphate dependent enzyme [Selenomonadaceae bacterium]
MIEIIRNKNRGGKIDTSNYSFANTEQIRRLHKSLNVYNETPLIELKNFAREKNLAAVFVKDESSRFGLKAFKALGGVWAIYKVISRELGLENPTLEEIFQRRDEISEMTFITTTDGNHGKGVSWAAGLFGCKSFVYMPKNTVEIRAQAIRDAGSATVEITDMTYDDCVKFTAQLAAKNHWHLIQDTSWTGYEEIPAQIMLGYSTLAYEVLEQMNHASTVEQKIGKRMDAAITSDCLESQSRQLGQASRLPDAYFFASRRWLNGGRDCRSLRRKFSRQSAACDNR